MQAAAAVAGGGNGSISATNEHVSAVQETGSVTARSGVSVALAPTPAPGTTPAAGITTAASGTANANGVTVANNVANTQAGAVRVDGQNQATVGVTTHSEAVVNDTAAALAQSGQAWAVAAGANGAPSNVNTPVAAAVPTSAAVSATGLQAQTNVSTSASATVTVPGGAATGPINVSVEPSPVTVVSGGQAVASSAATCAGTTCAAGSTGADSANDQARAASGAANAQGVVAQNTVNTSARVDVNVHGQNFAPIQVIIDSVTHILNWGAGSATSGDTTAGSGGTTSVSSGSGATAASGNAQATGAQVQNTVNMGASASVHVTGDNHNPINVVLNLAADLLNWGMGVAHSGDAQASGAGSGGSASSGGATATGLQAINLVNMWADASVDVDGNNYAPITVIINFNTRIRNYGAADASTGNVAAGQSNPSGSSKSSSGTSHSTNGSSGSAGDSASSGNAGMVSSARGGTTVAIGNSVSANVVSQQVGNANGRGQAPSSVITQLLQSLPSDNFNPLLPRGVAAAVTPTPQAGITSTGGDAVARGMQSTLVQRNIQMAACQDPGIRCLARNDATMTFSSADVGPNPLDPGSGSGSGGSSQCGICASGSFVGVNATPTPVPTRTSTTGSQTSNDGSGSGSGGSRHQLIFASTNQVVGGGGDLAGAGYYVDVDLWDQWPGRRLPPMPNLLSHKPSGTNVDVSLDGWPGTDELPLPEPASPVEVAGASAAAPAVAAPRLSRRGSTDLTLETDDDAAVPLLEIYNVSTSWPDAEMLPMPSQAPRALASVAPQVDSSPSPSSVADASDDSSSAAAGVEFGPAVLLAALLAALGASRRGRLFLASLAGAVAATVRGLPARVIHPVPTWLVRRTTHGLAVLRLVLGVLRLWILSLFRLA